MNSVDSVRVDDLVIGVPERDTGEVFGEDLLDLDVVGAALRLVGVRVSGLVPASGANAQLTFDDRPVGWREAERAMDKITNRFGASAVRPAALVEDPDRPAEGGF